MAAKRKHLSEVGIAKRTLDIYQREVSLFLDYLDACSIAYPQTFVQLDHQLAEYINVLYQEGESLSRAGWVLSGLKRLYPRCRKELQTWYTNWTRDHTPQRATPITWHIVQGFIGLCISQRGFSLALTILLNFVFFLRTGEAMNLNVSDISLVHSSSTVVLRLGYTKMSKHFQQFVAYSDASFFALAAYLLNKCDPVGKVWPYSLTYFRRCFSALSAFFDLSSCHFVPYSLRRGGATHFYGVDKALDYVMVQGRWKDQRTARQYLDDARATLISLHPSPFSRSLLFQFQLSLFSLLISLRK